MDWKLEVVMVPVSDVDRAKEFYADKVGFAVDLDRKIGDDVRIVQLTPPGSGCSIVISEGLSQTSPGSVQGLQLVVTDIDEAHRHLVTRGVDASPIQHFDGPDRAEGPGGDWNSFIFFSDPDGNGWAVQKGPS